VQAAAAARQARQCAVQRWLRHERGDSNHVFRVPGHTIPTCARVETELVHPVCAASGKRQVLSIEEMLLFMENVCTTTSNCVVG